MPLWYLPHFHGVIFAFTYRMSTSTPFRHCFLYYCIAPARCICLIFFKSETIKIEIILSVNKLWKWLGTHPVSSEAICTLLSTTTLLLNLQSYFDYFVPFNWLPASWREQNCQNNCQNFVLVFSIWSLSNFLLNSFSSFVNLRRHYFEMLIHPFNLQTFLKSSKIKTPSRSILTSPLFEIFLSDFNVHHHHGFSSNWNDLKCNEIIVPDYFNSLNVKLNDLIAPIVTTFYLNEIH